MRIGELLIMNGIINDHQLEEALKQQLIHSDKKVGELLIDQGDITERQLVEVLEFQIGVPVINMAETIFEDEAIHLIDERMARQYHMIPIQRKNGMLKLAMEDPLNHEAIKHIEQETGLTVQPFIATRNEVHQTINHHYGIIRMIADINHIIESAVMEQVKYIHYIHEEDQLAIKFQIGGKLQLHKILLKDQQQAMIDRIKLMSGLELANPRVPQEGRIHIQTDQKRIDVQVSILPTINGDSILMHILHYSDVTMELSDLGLSPENLNALDLLAQKNKGMLFIAGPTNSGQSSTLYAIINHLKSSKQNIISLENLVEQRIKGITQVDVNARIGFTYTKALQFALMRNPDMMMIDSLNNKETMEIAAEASVAGCLIVCGSKARNAIQLIRSMTSSGMDNHLLASALSGVIAQRLVRRICKHCAQTVTATEDEIKLFEEHHLVNMDSEKHGSKNLIGNFRTYVAAQLSGKMTVVRGSGCQVCSQSGYSGYIGIHEVLDIDQKLKQLMNHSLSDPELELYLQERSYKTMLYDGLIKVRGGLTTVEEVLKVVH